MVRPINTDDEHNRLIKEFSLYLDSDHVLDIESIEREDWDSMQDPCPECTGTEFDHVRYEGGHYGQQENAIIERTDYWYQQGSLYTACKSCDEVLYKHPAYDLLEAVETDEFDLLEEE